MSWLASITVAVLTAIAGALAAGYVSALAVDWYHVSSFEGGSGFMIVGLGMLGGFAGLIIGLVVSRIVAKRSKPGFLKALALSNGLVLALAAVAGGAARLMADVPPTIGGEELLLAVEIRFPAGHEAPAGDARDWAVRLSASSGGRVRVSRMGPLWKEDARQVEGRWVVPGAVEVFTSRGSRVLDILPDDVSDTGFLVPLPGYPGQVDLQWSDWLPRARSGEPPPPDGMSYRFKVVPRSQPVRTEIVGPFEISTVARSFSYLGTGTDGTPYQADADFLVRYRDEPVVFEHGPAGQPPATFDRARAVAVLPGPGPALLVYVVDGYESGHYFLLDEDGGALRTGHVATGPLWVSTFRLAPDAETFAQARDRRPLVGRVDRGMYADGGLYLVGDAVLDATRHFVRPFSAQPRGHVRLDLPPVSLSPDGRSFARIGFDADSAETRVLHVIDTVADEAYAVPIDMAAMRLASLEAADPAWVAHYFAWERGADQVDRLVARAGVKPLPYKGTLTTDRDGYREYCLQLAPPSVADALVSFLTAELEAEVGAKGEFASGYELRIGGRTVNVTVDGANSTVSVWMERGTDTQLVADIARRFDDALATGKYDAAFSPQAASR